MHKGIILLVEASNNEIAKNKVNTFMERYKDNVWDWFVIGGRWTGTLSGYNPYKDLQNLKTCWLCNGTGLRNDELGQSERLKNPKYGCNGCGKWNNKLKCITKGTGKQLKSASDFPDMGNISSLKDCIDIVKKWQQTEKDGLKEIRKAKRWLKPQNDKNDYTMYGYSLECASKILQQSFSFECNVFNIEDYNFSIPKSYDGWYAVIVDIHN